MWRAERAARRARSARAPRTLATARAGCAAPGTRPGSAAPRGLQRERGLGADTQRHTRDKKKAMAREPHVPARARARVGINTQHTRAYRVSVPYALLVLATVRRALRGRPVAARADMRADDAETQPVRRPRQSRHQAAGGGLAQRKRRWRPRGIYGAVLTPLRFAEAATSAGSRAATAAAAATGGDGGDGGDGTATAATARRRRLRRRLRRWRRGGSGGGGGLGLGGGAGGDDGDGGGGFGLGGGGDDGGKGGLRLGSGGDGNNGSIVAATATVVAATANAEKGSGSAVA